MGQNSGAWDLSVPLANRFAHLHWPLRVDEWQSGYLDGWPDLMPLGIDAAPSAAAVRCQRRLQTAFVVRRPQLLCDPPDGSVSPQGWPSPRSWDRLAYCTAAAHQAQAGDTVCAVIAAALVGEAAAAEFLAFVDNPDMPEPADLLTDPERFCELVSGDQQLAALDAVAALAEADPGLWRDAFQGVHRRRECRSRRCRCVRGDAASAAQAPQRAPPPPGSKASPRSSPQRASSPTLTLGRARARGSHDQRALPQCARAAGVQC